MWRRSQALLLLLSISGFAMCFCHRLKRTVFDTALESDRRSSLSNINLMGKGVGFTDLLSETLNFQYINRPGA